MDAPFYVVETSGFPITRLASRMGRSHWGNPEFEIAVHGPNGSRHHREVISPRGGHFTKRLSNARATAENICWRLNRDEQT